MSLQFDPITGRHIVVLDSVDGWDNCIFVRQDIANVSGIWPYCDPQLAETELKHLVEPIKPLMTTFHPGATRLSDLSEKEKTNFKWEYGEWEMRFAEWEELLRTMRKFNCEISSSVARKYLHLLWDKPSPMNDSSPYRTI